LLGSRPEAYARAWHDTFAGRIRASSVFAALTVPPGRSRASVAVLERLPAVLTLGAALEREGAHAGGARMSVLDRPEAAPRARFLDPRRFARRRREPRKPRHRSLRLIEIVFASRTNSR
jgi:hypothetical protein